MLRYILFPDQQTEQIRSTEAKHCRHSEADEEFKYIGAAEIVTHDLADVECKQSKQRSHRVQYDSFPFQYGISRVFDFRLLEQRCNDRRSRDDEQTGHYQ